MGHEIDLLRRQVADLQAENSLLRRRLEGSPTKSAQAALRQSDEKFRLAFQTSPDSINFNRLSDGMYLDINEGFTKLTGYTHEDAVGRTSVDLNIWYDSKDRERLVQALMSHGYVENFESRFRKKNSQIGIGLMSARILTMNGERVILSITRDITDREKIQEALQKSEEQYRSIFENAIEGFFQSTPAGRFIRVNRAFAKMCGYASPEEMVAAIRDIGEQHYGCRKERERFIALLNEKGAVENFEHTARRKDGTTFWVSVSARVVRDSNHQMVTSTYNSPNSPL